jgi:periplasmic protein TonB
MTGSTWLAAAAISIAAHASFAAWVDARELTPRPPRPTMQMQLVAPPPKPAPKIVELPPPPPPPKLQPVRKIVRAPVAAAAASPPIPSAGIAPDTSSHGDFAVAPGDGIDGVVGDVPTPAPPMPEPAAAAPPAPHGKRFVPEYKVTRLPQAKTPIRPELPEAFRAAQREAHVTVEVEIDETGRVVHARVLGQAELGLDAAVLAAVEKTAFEPALVGAQPVAVRYHIPFTFRVHG